MKMTPLMRQYQAIKQRYVQEIVLFQVGDFYEIFYEDAQRASAFLGITLTARGQSDDGPIPLCGFPCHAADTYLVKLVTGGFRVVLCDQVAGPDATKLMERVVSQVLTPGTVTDPKLLDEKSANYVAVVAPGETAVAILFVEILTGQVFATVLEQSRMRLIESELGRFLPKEVVVPHTERGIRAEKYIHTLGYETSIMLLAGEDAELRANFVERVSGDAAQGLVQHSVVLQTALQTLYHFLERNHAPALTQLRPLELYAPDDFLILDAATQRNLELVKNNSDNSARHTLFAVLDEAVTPMGSRMIKKWILRPLVNRAMLEQRLAVVQQLVTLTTVRTRLAELLRAIGDCERVVGRIALKRALLADYVQLMQTLAVLPELAQICAQAFPGMFGELLASVQICTQLSTRLQASLNTDPEHDWKIKQGYYEELDRLRRLAHEGAQAMLALEQREQLATGISSLKIRYNGAHGYGIEVTKPNVHLVPPHYVRLQTLVNRERFTNQELKDLEYDIKRAQTSSLEIEQELFAALSAQIFEQISLLQSVARACAELDAFVGFARVACRPGYVRPIFDGHDCAIQQGRHPVVEAALREQNTTQFIANDLTLSEQQRLWIITGPNMGGKSTFLRQSALLAIMAQAGSFVPAAHAQIPLFDRIFTRIGAADMVAQGKSTFLVEMEETALICHEATERSLVILDEVGRGTSTYDGLAIAQAVLEYIYFSVKAKCLFATHYHELTELAQRHAGIVTYYAASQKTATGIVLLHQIKQGCAQGSFGIEVAKSAKLPDAVLHRAQEILAEFLAHQHLHAAQRPSVPVNKNHPQEITPATPLFSPQDYDRYQRLCAELERIDCNALTPRQAFDLVWKLKELRS